nr:neuronal-specific septin-3 isoform X1 [Misgurnus anguillicaudatus]
MLKHVDARIPQTLVSYQKKRRSQDPNLVQIRLGLIKTGRIVNVGTQLSQLEKRKPSSEENESRIQDGPPCILGRLPLPIHSKIMLGSAKEIGRPNLMCQGSAKHQNHKKNFTQASMKEMSQTSQRTPSPKITTNQEGAFQKLGSTISLKGYNEVISSRRQNRAVNDISKDLKLMINPTQLNQSSNNDNLTSKSKNRPQFTGSETDLNTSIYASGQCGRISNFQFPLKSHGSSTECSQLGRICRPVIKRACGTPDSRLTYLKSPQACRIVSSSTNQTGSTGGNGSSSQNRCPSDSDSSKSSSSEATLREDYKRYRGSRLHKKTLARCRMKFVGEEKREVAVQPAPPDLLCTQSTESPNTQTNLVRNFEMNECFSQSPLVQEQQQEEFLCNTDSIKNTVFEHKLQQQNTAECKKFHEIHTVQLSEQEDHPQSHPSVDAEIQSCAGKCVSADMSEIVPPEVRPKPAVPAKPSHVTPPSGVPFLTSPQGTGGEGQGSGRGSTLLGYIGIDTIIEQMRKKTMKTGFDFNIMVVGQSGLGKSTLVNTLFKSQVSRRTTAWSRDEKIPKTVEIKSVSHVIEEGGVKMKLTVVDTPGFGDQINNNNCWEPISKYINEQYEKFLKEEVNISRKKRIPDTRVHCCLYFISPTGHSLRQLDIEFMKHLSRSVNIIPVIAKSDTLTPEEKTEFKQRVRKELEACGIECYPQKEFDEDMEDKSDNDKIREAMPFAVVGSDKEYQFNGKRVLGRKSAWGMVEVENPDHCEFSLLRDFLIRSHLQDLKEVTHNIHYETYRAKRLNDNGGLHLISSSGNDTQESNL